MKMLRASTREACKTAALRAGFVYILDKVVLVGDKPRSAVISYLGLADGTHVQVKELAGPDESFGRGRFMILFQDAVRAAVMEFRSGPALRILLALPDKLDWRAWRRLDQQALANELCLARSQVTTCLLDFIRLGYVERRGKRSQYEWRLLPKLGWRGSVRQYHSAVAAGRDSREPSLPLGPVKIAESILWKVKLYPNDFGGSP